MVIVVGPGCILFKEDDVVVSSPVRVHSRFGRSLENGTEQAGGKDWPRSFCKPAWRGRVGRADGVRYQ